MRAGKLKDGEGGRRRPSRAEHAIRKGEKKENVIANETGKLIDISNESGGARTIRKGKS